MNKYSYLINNLFYQFSIYRFLCFLTQKYIKIIYSIKKYLNPNLIKKMNKDII